MRGVQPTDSIMNLYRESVKKVPLLKYSWVVVATICLLALSAYFKLKNRDVFIYALYILLFCFLGFIFSFLTRTRDKVIKTALYILVYCIIITIGGVVLSFFTYIMWGRPAFYSKFISPKAEKFIPEEYLTPTQKVLKLSKLQVIFLQKKSGFDYSISDYFKTDSLKPAELRSISFGDFAKAYFYSYTDTVDFWKKVRIDSSGQRVVLTYENAAGEIQNDAVKVQMNNAFFNTSEGLMRLNEDNWYDNSDSDGKHELIYRYPLKDNRFHIIFQKPE